jgi:protein-S-isoprenylcysteine O-methyltransferase Ste14
MTESSTNTALPSKPANTRTTWQKIARRIRVPLGFVMAAIFLVFARPTPHTLLWSLLLVLPGLWLRGYAAGYVKKNAELTRTGPYAYTRNPLYLGSMSIAFGFAIATDELWLGLLLVALLLAIYLPTILSEETFLRATFPTFDAYAERVPRLLPRLTPARFSDISSPAGRFAPERYRHHREYNALVGAAAIYLALGLRMAAPALHALWGR